MLILRPYQNHLVNIADNTAYGRLLFVLATAMGKTVIFTSIKRKGRILILSHRKELVMNPIQYYDIPVGVVLGNRLDTEEEVITASVQTMKNRLNAFAPDAFDTIIVDEAHHIASPSYQQILNYFKPRLLLGLTATPYRLDGKSLGFDKVINEYDIKFGIENGYLADIYCQEVNVGYDLSRVRKTAGDLNKKDLDNAVACTAEAVAKAYKQNTTPDNYTIIFAVSVKHANAIAEHINGAYVVTGKTPHKERDELIEKFRKRKIKCLVTCELLTEGVDLPYTDTIILARPTTSKGLYYQMIGRGLRNPDGNKKLHLIDCVGNTGKHDICSIPDIMGIEVPEKKKKKVRKLLEKGTDISTLEDKILNLSETEDIKIKVNTSKTRRLFDTDININIENVLTNGIYAHEIIINNNTFVVVNMDNQIVRLKNQNDFDTLLKYFKINGIKPYQTTKYKRKAMTMLPSEKQMRLIRALTTNNIQKAKIKTIRNMDDANKLIAELKIRRNGTISPAELQKYNR